MKENRAKGYHSLIFYHPKWKKKEEGDTRRAWKWIPCTFVPLAERKVSLCLPWDCGRENGQENPRGYGKMRRKLSTGNRTVEFPTLLSVLENDGQFTSSKIQIRNCRSHVLEKGFRVISITTDGTEVNSYLTGMEIQINDIESVFRLQILDRWARDEVTESGFAI